MQDLPFARALALTVILLFSGNAEADTPPPAQWVTLGTNSGPLAFTGRNQPANLLVADGQKILVDAGDGAAEELLRYGAYIDDVQAVFISHLHFDHTGGLFAFLGRRFQVRSPSTVTIYGPPGTKATVEALLAAMQPMVDADGSNGIFASMARKAPADTVKVVELKGGSKLALGNIQVTAAVNSHYILSDEKSEGNHSFAFRFDTPGRSIVYSGDTGPSANVEALAKDADLLITEVMDADEALDRIGKPGTGMKINFVTAAVLKTALKGHFTKQHLSPEESGLMAQRSGAKALLLTHNALDAASLAAARQRIAKNYPGPVTFAEDMRAY